MGQDTDVGARGGEAEVGGRGDIARSGSGGEEGVGGLLRACVLGGTLRHLGFYGGRGGERGVVFTSFLNRVWGHLEGKLGFQCTLFQRPTTYAAHGFLRIELPLRSMAGSRMTRWRPSDGKRVDQPGTPRNVWTTFEAKAERGERGRGHQGYGVDLPQRPTRRLILSVTIYNFTSGRLCFKKKLKPTAYLDGQEVH